MKWKLVAAAVIALTPNSVLAAEGKPLGNGWTLYENDEDCAVMGSFERETIFRFAYDPARNDAFITVYDQAFKSLKEDEKYELDVIVLKGSVLDDGWGKKTAIGMKVGDLTGFSMILHGRDFLSDFKQATGIAFKRGDIIVESLSMKGSTLAGQALERCSLALQRRKPIDPFKD